MDRAELEWHATGVTKLTLQLEERRLEFAGHEGHLVAETAHGKPVFACDPWVGS